MCPSFSFNNFDLENIDDVTKLIKDLKIIYEDFWKENNLIQLLVENECPQPNQDLD